MTDWATVDAWKRDRINAAAELRAGADLVRDNMRQIRRERRIRANVERWFRQLPPTLVLMLIGESTGVLAYDIGALTVANDWLLENGFHPGRHLPRRAATPGELALIKALKVCRFPPASFSKRFVRELDETHITDGQIAQARRLVTTFRKQIPTLALHEADRHLLTKPKTSRSTNPTPRRSDA